MDTRPSRPTALLRAAAPVTAALLLLGGCGDAPTAPASGAEVVIELAVSGGIAGVDWAVRIDGPAGLIRGLRCRNRVGCDWGDGDALGEIREEALLGLARAFLERGFLDLGHEDFGTRCCDDFHVVLSYRDHDDRKTARGSMSLLPASVRGLVHGTRDFVDSHRDRSGGASTPIADLEGTLHPLSGPGPPVTSATLTRIPEGGDG